MVGGHKNPIKTTKIPTSRKELRKQIRKAKKEKRNEFFKNKKKVGSTKLTIDTDNNLKKGNNTNPLKNEKGILAHNDTKKSAVSRTSYLDEQNQLHKREMKDKAKLNRSIQKNRKKMLLKANEYEDKELKKLEKHLKLNKRKTKTIPKSFTDDGLDYLLEVCDTEKLKENASVEMNLLESGSDFENDFAVVTKKLKRKSKIKEKLPSKKQKIKSKCSSSDEGSAIDSDLEDEDSFSEEEKESVLSSAHSDTEHEEEGPESDHSSDGTLGDENGSEHGSLLSDNEAENDTDNEDGDIIMEKSENLDDQSADKEKKSGTWEDIYGRLRDKKGNIIQERNEQKYIPPHLRTQHLGQNDVRMKELSRLKKQLKGLINRLAASNMHSIASQVDELYMRNSRNDMNDTLLALVTEALVGQVLTAERLVMEHAMLIAILHANVGMEVGAHFLECFVKRFDSIYKTGATVENKELDNVLLILSHLYNFKIVHSQLMYNILDLMTEQFSEKDVELILLVLRSVGFNLRKDDPLAVKELVLKLQKKASESTHLRDNPRVRFMLDVLLAVKNNNMTKIPQYDPSYSEHLKKLLKTMIQKGKYITELKVTLDDLLKADDRGRWWIVGSAWSGNPSSVTPTTQVPTEPESPGFNQAVLELARKQRMNTSTRRNIFCILITAEDYQDAFEKLLRLGLKGPQEREIIHVMSHCLLQEKEYNPYYAHLATHFCQADRKYQMNIQYCLWDKFKELKNFNQFQITNLAKFLAHLFLEKALPISVLKVLQFSEMDKLMVQFLRQVLLFLLMSESVEAITAVFARVSLPEKLHMFRESLRLFLHHFVLKNVSSLPADQADLIKQRVRLAEVALTTAETKRL